MAILGVALGALLGEGLSMAIGGVIGNKADKIFTKETLQRLVNYFNQDNRLKNHDLQKALQRSYYLALKSICEELLENSNTYKNNKDWFIDEIGDISSILKQIDKGRSHHFVINDIDLIKLLLTTEASSDKDIKELEEQLIEIALDRDNPPQSYTELVRKSLYARVCGFFSFEIKNNEVVKNIFQSQILVNTNIKIEEISSELRKNTNKIVPQLFETISRIEVTMLEVKVGFENVKDILIQVHANQSQANNLLEEILRLIKALAPSTRPVKSFDDIKLEAVENSNKVFHEMYIKDEVFTRNINESILCNVTDIDSGKIYIYEKNELAIVQALKNLWNRKNSNAIITGDGGMGKTTTLRILWSYILKNHKNILPIYINLNSFNREYEQYNEIFIASKVKKSYIKELKLVKEEQHGLIQYINMATNNTANINTPEVVLMLDGYNEITVEQMGVINELLDILSCNVKIQIIITSRNKPINSIFDRFFYELVLNNLTQDQIDKYLNKNIEYCNISMKLLQNPMMLCLLNETNNILSDFMYNQYNLKRYITSEGELIWNYVTAQQIKYTELLILNKKNIYNKRVVFAIGFLLPYVGYSMEKKGIYEIDDFELKKLVASYIREFAELDYGQFFNEFDDCYLELGLNGTLENYQYRKLSSNYIQIINRILSIMRVKNRDGSSSDIYYEFTHEIFRDFFAACHIMNNIKICISKKTIEGDIVNNKLNYNVRKLIGQILGEHNNVPEFDIEIKQWSKMKNHSLLNEFISLCKGRVDGSVGFAVCNIVKIWRDVRGELSGEDLSNLDLREVNLSSIKLRKKYKNNSIATTFDEALIDEKNFFNQKHKNLVNSCIISQDNSRIITASRDNSIRVWDTITGECINILNVHTASVNSISNKGNTGMILSASEDGSLIEWNLNDNSHLKIISNDKYDFRNAIYSNCGKFIITDVYKEEENIHLLIIFDIKCKNIIFEKKITKVNFNTINRCNNDTIFTFIDLHKNLYEFSLNKMDYIKGKLLSEPISKKICIFPYENVPICYHPFENSYLIFINNHLEIYSSVTHEFINRLDITIEKTYRVFSVMYNLEATKLLITTIKRDFSEIKDDIDARDYHKINHHVVFEYNLKTKEKLLLFSYKDTLLKSVFYSPDGSRLIIIEGLGWIKGWDINHNKRITQIFGFNVLSKNNIINITQNQDSTKIAASIYNGDIVEWDNKLNKISNIFEAKENEKYPIVYLSYINNEKLISVTDGGIIRLWNMINYDYSDYDLLCDEIINSRRISFNSDGSRILIRNNNQLSEWNISNANCLWSIEINIVFNENEDWLMSLLKYYRTLDSIFDFCFFFNRPYDKELFIINEDKKNNKTFFVGTNSNYMNSDEKNNFIIPLNTSDNNKLFIATSLFYKWDDFYGKISKGIKNLVSMNNLPINIDFNKAMVSYDNNIMIKLSLGDILIIDISKNCIINKYNIDLNYVIEDCTFRNLHLDSIISNKFKKLLLINGAKI